MTWMRDHHLASVRVGRLELWLSPLGALLILAWRLRSARYAERS